MAGRVVRAVKRIIIEGGSNVAASAAGSETSLVTNIRAADFKYLMLALRLHAATWGAGTGQKLTVRLRSSAPTDEDPAQTFRDKSAALVTAEILLSDTAPFVKFVAATTDFPAFVDLTYQFTQGTSANVNHVLTISADISFKS